MEGLHRDGLDVVASEAVPREVGEAVSQGQGELGEVVVRKTQRRQRGGEGAWRDLFDVIFCQVQPDEPSEGLEETLWHSGDVVFAQEDGAHRVLEVQEAHIVQLSDFIPEKWISSI